MRDPEFRAFGPEAADEPASGYARPGNRVKLWLAWLAVGIPLAWGIWMTLSKAIALFR